MPIQIVNNNQPVKTVYYHCFKLNDSSYALFDVKMDMPIVIGSLSIIKTVKLPSGALVYYYKIHSGSGFFDKGANRFIEIKGEGKHQKAPLRYVYKVDPKTLFYHHFKLSNVLSVIFSDEFDMPLMYGDNQKIQAIKNKIDKEKQIFVYKEDQTFKNSFKLWKVETGSKS